MRLYLSGNVYRLSITVREINLEIGHGGLCLEDTQRWTIITSNLLDLNNKLHDRSYKLLVLAPLLGNAEFSPQYYPKFMNNLAFSVNGVQIGLAECALIFLFLFVVFLVIRNMTLAKEEE